MSLQVCCFFFYIVINASGRVHTSDKTKQSYLITVEYLASPCIACNRKFLVKASRLPQLHSLLEKQYPPNSLPIHFRLSAVAVSPLRQVHLPVIHDPTVQ